jgi:hypothetical protein
MYNKHNFNILYQYKILKLINFYNYKYISPYFENDLIKYKIDYMWEKCSKIIIGYKIKTISDDVIYPYLSSNFIKKKRILNYNILKKSLKLNIKKIILNIIYIPKELIILINSYVI